MSSTESNTSSTTSSTESGSAPASTAPKPMRVAKSARKPAVAVETHLSIEEQTAAFLKAGGKIDEVPRGISGQQLSTGPRSAPAPAQTKPAAAPADS